MKVNDLISDYNALYNRACNLATFRFGIFDDAEFFVCCAIEVEKNTGRLWGMRDSNLNDFVSRLYNELMPLYKKQGREDELRRYASIVKSSTDYPGAVNKFIDYICRINDLNKEITKKNRK